MISFSEDYVKGIEQGCLRDLRMEELEKKKK